MTVETLCNGIITNQTIDINNVHRGPTVRPIWWMEIICAGVVAMQLLKTVVKVVS
jgi:hypothetical protein